MQKAEAKLKLLNIVPQVAWGQAFKKPHARDKPEPAKAENKVTLFIKNVPTRMDDDRFKSVIKLRSQIDVLGCRLIRSSKGELKGIGYVDVATDEEASKVIESMHGYKQYDSDKPLGVSRQRDSENDPDVEKRTVMVKSVPEEAREDQIRAAFGKVGLIKEVRMIYESKDPSKFKGICFIEFEDEDSVAKAIEGLDRTTLMPSTPAIQVMPSKTREQLKQDHEKQRGQWTLHVKNLSYKTDYQQLNSFLVKTFSLQRSDISSTAIIKDKEGRSKGYAFVEMGSKMAMDTVLNNKETKSLRLAGRPLLISGGKKDEPQRKRDQKAEEKQEAKQSNLDFKNFILGSK